MDMTEAEEQELYQQAHDRMDEQLLKIFEDIRHVVHDKLGDTYSAEEVMSDEHIAHRIACSYVQRILFEIYYDEYGAAMVANQFDNLYYQISAQDIGPIDFSKVARPYRR